MTDKVIDASAMAALAFLEPPHSWLVEKLRGSRLFAPRLLPFEMMNVCVKKIRSQPHIRQILLRGFANFQATAIELRDVDPGPVMELAEHRGLSGYDASYLWLARHLGIELVTLDVQLAKAAARSL
ncbi:MAG TPA: type II toxin-antitoxin system VapC family toxin [Rhizomicrobium sp.]|nr:type II toxin-antitoxin system VapC family toxin [Rhizomicrobium sp.]